MFRPRLRLPRAGSRIQQPCQRRLLHRVPPLPHDFSKNGVPGLLSKEGFDIAWTQYMDLMLERVNDLTAGMYCYMDLDFMRITPAQGKMFSISRRESGLPLGEACGWIIRSTILLSQQAPTSMNWKSSRS